MKFWFILLCSCVLLFGCQQEQAEEREQNTVYPISLDVTEDDFVYRLQVNTKTFSVGEPVEMIASLTYVGAENEVHIAHAASPFYYEITETTRDYHISYPMDMPRIETTLKRGETIYHTYKTSGGYSDQDEPAYRDFMEQFLAGNYPAGLYKVYGYVEFWNEQNELMKIGGHIGFEVNE